MSFTNDEITSLRAQSMTRFATAGPEGQPDVVPLAFEFRRARILGRRRR
jgi:pyridoxamine 5'-phosphate oxidase family protein